MELEGPEQGEGRVVWASPWPWAGKRGEVGNTQGRPGGAGAVSGGMALSLEGVSWLDS